MAIISIIVPVYNVYDCLTECLESIRKQSLVDYECILVDDGSTDGSSEILDEYAKIDSRFIAIHQNNAGVGAARNAGLQIACGTFITFIDSDDKVTPAYLENMLQNIGMQDILVSGFMMCKPMECKGIGSVVGSPSTNNMARAMKEGLLNSCWGKLYKREVIQEIRFPERINWGEDTAYLLACLCKTKRVVFDVSYDYLYTYSTKGLANRFDKMKPLYLMSYYKQLILFLEQWAEIEDCLYNEVSIKISQEVLRTVDALIDNELLAKEEKEYLDMLFGTPQVNLLFSYGVRLDDNPMILKILSKFPSEMVWKVYVKIRRLVLKGKK